LAEGLVVVEFQIGEDPAPPCRTANRTLLHPANLRHILYIASRISSTARLTNGAADSPTRTPESERRSTTSMTKRAKINSHTISRTERRSQRTLAFKPSHSDAVNAKYIDVHRMQTASGSPARCQERVGSW